MFESLGVVNYWTYFVATLGIILLPGPNSIYVLTTAARSGVARGYQAACGVFVGDAILMTLSALGVASLLKTWPLLFLIVKSLGAVYLCYLGFSMLKGVWQKRRNHTLTEVSPTPPPKPVSKAPFRKALLLSLSNPKAILFFVAFFIQFVAPGYPHPMLPFLILGLTVQVCSFSYLTFLIFTGTSLAAWFARKRRLANSATVGVGLLFLGFGLRLALASLE